MEEKPDSPAKRLGKGKPFGMAGILNPDILKPHHRMHAVVPGNISMSSEPAQAAGRPAAASPKPAKPA